MSREIKFRAWHKLKKRWFTGREILGYINIISNDDKYIAGDFLQIPNLSNYDFVFAQFTGLTDKNGVEIYEGDVVRLNDDIGFIEFDIGKFYIHWAEARWMTDEIHALNQKIEVIGNIHEHPHLLEETNEST